MAYQYCRYAIRGTPHRSTLQWVAALDTMLSLHPAILVPQVSRAQPASWGDVSPIVQHTQPLHGEELVRETVTAYRDAIQVTIISIM